MTRYIDAHKLCLDLFEISDDSMRTLFISYVKNQPTAEVIELSKIEHDAELLKTDADGFKNRIQKDIDNGREPDQAMLIMMHTAVVSHSALTCLVDRYRRCEEE